MLKLVKVAVTGGLSSGKSLFCRYLKELGAKIVDADQIVRKLLSPNTTLGKKIIELLGPDVVIGETFNHKVIAEQVFQDKRKLEALEQLLHPAVFVEIERQYEEENRHIVERSAFFVAEIPLLFETGAEGNFDITIAVVAPENLCRKRYGMDDDYTQRMQRQWSPSDKSANADYVIENSGSKENLHSAAKNLFNLITYYPEKKGDVSFHEPRKH